MRPAKGTAQKARRARVAAKLRAWLALCKVVDARDGRRCRVCGAGGEIHRHHIVKRSQGGPDTLENVITLCPQCHTDVHNARLYISGAASEPWAAFSYHGDRDKT